MNLIDFSNCPYSNRHGMYGGMAGDKDGILYNNENWIIKYPKNMDTMNGVDKTQHQYTTAPLSEYIGSHIYKILGYNVHETLLGVRNNKIVVACKDFCETRGALAEVRSIKNAANAQIDVISREEFSLSVTGDTVDLNELEVHFKHNPILNNHETISRFWDQVIIDILIDNNDRNNGNWGFLFNENTEKYELAPIYDNGNAFSNKASDEQIRKYLQEKDNSRYIGSRTIYCKNNHILSAKKILKLDNIELQKALIRNIPKIQSHFKEILNMINEIPNTFNELSVCSETRKEFYTKGLAVRMNELLYPAYEKALSIVKDIDISIEEIEQE